MIGPERLIVTEGDALYCADCYADIAPGDDELDLAHMAVHARIKSGICECCNVELIDGNLN